MEEGEFCNVERVIEEMKFYDFTAKKGKIKSSSDVAYIFKSLEESAIEHAFVVAVKDGKPTILHLGMGGFDGAPIDTRMVIPVMNDIKPDYVYFVHNHPSGNLSPSLPDIEVFKSLRSVINGSGAVAEGLIIDTFSGQYCVFDELTADRMNEDEKTKEEKKVKVYSFSKQRFAENWIPKK